MAPPIEFALMAISKLVLSQPLMIWLYKLPLDQQVTQWEYQQIVEEQGRSPYSVDCEPFFLESDDVKSLFMVDKQKKPFWEVAIVYAGSNEARI